MDVFFDMCIVVLGVKYNNNVCFFIVCKGNRFFQYYQVKVVVFDVVFGVGMGDGNFFIKNVISVMI